MSSSFDISRFPDLPPEVLKAFEAQQAALDASRMETIIERAARLHHEAIVSEKEGLIATLKELIEKLEGQVGQYRRAKFGPKSEKLHPDQLQLALEDIETAIAETQEQIAAVEKQIEATQADKDKKPRKPRKERKLPDNLPRIEQVIEPESIACPCGCGDMVRIASTSSPPAIRSS
jgi:transposase